MVHVRAGEKGWKGELIAEARFQYTASNPFYQKGSSQAMSQAKSSKDPSETQAGSAPQEVKKKRLHQNERAFLINF